MSELHAVLKVAGIGPPYVMVGAAQGGFYARLFASTYPQDVHGLVLLNGSVENSYDGFSQLHYQDQVVTLKEAERCRALAASGALARSGKAMFDCVGLPDARLSSALNRVVRSAWQRPNVYDTFISEHGAFDSDAREVHKAERSYGSMPLTIIVGDSLGLPSDPPSIRRQMPAFARHWIASSRRWERLSNRTRFRVQKGAGWDLELDHPALVANEILNIVRQARRAASR